jgi:hypothetical protein
MLSGVLRSKRPVGIVGSYMSGHEHWRPRLFTPTAAAEAAAGAHSTLLIPVSKDFAF